MHTMNVQAKYYNLLKSGIKTVELRLFDEKRQKIKVGDEIVFSNLSDPNDHFKALVLGLHRADSFNDLCHIISPAQAGFSTRDELVAVMSKFYTLSAQKEWGVVGIEIRKI